MNYNNYSTEICGHKIEVVLGETSSCSPWFLDACIEHDINLMISADMHWWMRIDNDAYSLDDLTDPHKLIDYFEHFAQDEMYCNNEGEEAGEFFKTMFDIELKNLVNNEFEYMGFKFEEKEENFQEFLNKRKKK